MEIQFSIIGIALVILAVIHIIFPKYFHWKEDLSKLSLINGQMMRTHTFFIALTVFLMGLLCLTSATELYTTGLGKKICLGLGVFWIIRLFFQLFVYSRKLWSGKTFETVVHIVFTLFWAYLSYTFLSVYVSY